MEIWGKIKIHKDYFSTFILLFAIVGYIIVIHKFTIINLLFDVSNINYVIR